MANIFGSCTGSTGSKYDLWITVIQNSQSLAQNKSNITTNFFIRRNDGSANSAYNLIDGSNTVLIKVGGETKLNKSITIDTRNNVYCLLGSWTGDVTHNSDGSLTVPVYGKFTMGNDTLTGGTVSGSFKCTTLGKASTLTFGNTTVNPGGTVTVTVNSSSSSFTHKIKWTLGTKSQTVTLGSGVVNADFTVPLAWTTEIQKSLTGTLTATLETYSSNVKTGTSSYNVKVIIPATDQFKPSFDLVLTRNDNGVPASWGEYVKGVSTLTVLPDNVTYKYGASYYSISMAVGSFVQYEIPSTFELTQSGSVKVTVTVKDSRGLVTVKSTTINVCDYSPPSVNVNLIIRCNNEGAIDSMGTSGLLKSKLAVSSVNGKNSYSTIIKYRQSLTGSWSTGEELSSESQVFGEGLLDINKSYTVSVLIKDSITTQGVETILNLPSGDIPFNIRKGGKGASFGKFSESDNLLDVNWDLKVNGGIELSGMLNYEKVLCQCTEKAENMVADLRYYPALDTVFVRIKLILATDLAANDTHYVAKVSDRFPGLFMPMSCLVGFENGGQSTAGILYGSGYIVVRSDTPMYKGTQIYISGFYVADYKGA